MIFENNGAGETIRNLFGKGETMHAQELQDENGEGKIPWIYK